MGGWAQVLPRCTVSQNQGEVTQAGSQSSEQDMAGSVGGQGVIVLKKMPRAILGTTS